MSHNLEQAQYDCKPKNIAACLVADDNPLYNRLIVAINKVPNSVARDSFLGTVQFENENGNRTVYCCKQAGMDILYQAELERHLDRKATLEQNLHKAYALIFSTYCNNMMRNRIEEHSDYKTTIQDDPIELRTKIKVLMHNQIRAKYPFASP